MPCSGALAPTAGLSCSHTSGGRSPWAPLPALWPTPAVYRVLPSNLETRHPPACLGVCLGRSRPRWGVCQCLQEVRGAAGLGESKQEMPPLGMCVCVSFFSHCQLILFLGLCYMFVSPIIQVTELEGRGGFWEEKEGKKTQIQGGFAGIPLIVWERLEPIDG